ncbi:MAG: acyloxyacyl hydrolase [Candidatus Omnitrophota bacterium]|nr:acyloxyacyl hydrolase [Candidatus Omnitrophota bacterium]
MARVILGCVIVLVLSMGITSLVNAEPADTINSDATLKEVGLYSGWGTAEVGDDGASKNYDTIYIGGRFGFNLKKLLKLNMPGMLLSMVEPFVNPVTEPSSNYEAGCGVLLKYAFPVTKKFYPYIEGGTGFIYISEKTRKQGSHMNFVDQAGAGIYYFIDDSWALNAGYRFRHISNLGIKKPNGGIDSHFAILGASRFF